MRTIPTLILDRIFRNLPDKGLHVAEIMLTSAKRDHYIADGLPDVVCRNFVDRRQFILHAARQGLINVLYATNFKFSKPEYRIILETALAQGRVNLARVTQARGGTLTICQIMRHVRWTNDWTLRTMAEIDVPFTLGHFFRFLRQKAQFGCWNSAQVLLDALVREHPDCVNHDFKMGAAILCNRPESVMSLLRQQYPVRETERLLLVLMNHETLPQRIWTDHGFPNVTAETLVRANCSRSALLFISGDRRYVVELAKISIEKENSRMLENVCAVALPNLLRDCEMLCEAAISTGNVPILKVIRLYGLNCGMSISLTEHAINLPVANLNVLLSLGATVPDPIRFLFMVLDRCSRDEFYLPILRTLRSRQDYMCYMRDVFYRCQKDKVWSHASILWSVMVERIQTERLI